MEALAAAAEGKWSSAVGEAGCRRAAASGVPGRRAAGPVPYGPRQGASSLRGGDKAGALGSRGGLGSGPKAERMDGVPWCFRTVESGGAQLEASIVFHAYGR